MKYPNDFFLAPFGRLAHRWEKINRAIRCFIIAVAFIYALLLYLWED